MTDKDAKRDMNYDVIIVGSGAGGCAAAYHLTQTDKKVLLLERGRTLPADGSTLDVNRVLKLGEFKTKEVWMDKDGKPVVPGEFPNLGGKTKWYGAALLRMSLREFESESEFNYREWPIRYDDLAPFYDEAERLLGVRTFDIEPDMLHLLADLQRVAPKWKRRAMPLGLSEHILSHPKEARHFDGYALPNGLKADGESALLNRVKHQPNITIVTDTEVTNLVADKNSCARIVGVQCANGEAYFADKILLAAGALHSPRLLQRHVAHSGITLQGERALGSFYKCHLNSAMLVFSGSPRTDVLWKTVLLLNDQFPHSSVQCIGGDLPGEILATQIPGFVPTWFSSGLSRRVFGLFLTTEDSSHADNRVTAKLNGEAAPQLNFDWARSPKARAEHRSLIQALRRALLRLGFLVATKNMPLEATAHACGTMAAGRDPSTSVVDKNGKVHGMENLYVVDGSVFARSASVNPALTIYAWALRVAARL
ncbi:MAG: FAD-dependent oxidoreductase [Burkholderiales bacterium]